MELTELGTRWLHFGAGVLWIGILYFFNWVNSAFAPTMDGDTKKKVVPELMPRALYWFRWGAAFTWVTGVLLLFLVYYHGYDGANLFDGQHPAPTAGDWGPAFAGILIGFLVYDILFKSLAKQHEAAVIAWGVIALGFAWFLKSQQGFSDRAVYIHVAALFGTSMAANVWMRIWPAQKRIITAIKNGDAPDPADVGLAGLRSKHNTYMSFSLLLFMVGVGQTMMFNYHYLGTIAAVLVISWVACYLIYKKAATVPGF